MFKISSRGAATLMLLGALVGSLTMTNALAMSNSTRKTLTRLQTKQEKVTKTSRKVDREFDRVGVKNLNALMQADDNGQVPTELDSGLSVYQLSRATKVSIGGKKTVTLPKGAIVRGSKYTLNPKFPSRFSINIADLTKANQRKAFKAFGVTTENCNFVLDSKNKTRLLPYQKSTAFSYKGDMNLPTLQAKNLQSYYDSDRQNNPFIIVTADNYLNYYTNYQAKKSGRIQYDHYAQSVKIKKFTRGASTYTYYLAKPLKGFGAKKVRVGKKTEYRLTVSLGHVFQAFDNDNLDPGMYRMTVKVGKKAFYVDLGGISEAYINRLTNNPYGSNVVDQTAAQAYIQGLK
ncbi:hypothetical protein [Levilactobacillus yonginensis]|uniref:hypothetical protein n=1 Tax=Levilactobacillus yonginensis TaxID=1054041 RepID=UPI000F787128|nr:hypothetical protein [Levilactobacillus yonginensis]